jgi:hypothetical protein
MGVGKRSAEGMFGAKGGKVAEKLIKLHNDLHSVCSSPNIVRTIKSRRKRCEARVDERGWRNKDYVLQYFCRKTSKKRASFKLISRKQ